jgi:hypothetical protein
MPGKLTGKMPMLRWTMPTNARFAGLWAATAALAALAGCSSGTPVVNGGDAKLTAQEMSPEFIDRVNSQKYVSENDAMRGVLMLVDGKDEHETFQQRVDALRERKIVDASWDFRADRPVTRGRYAYMIYQSLHVRGGVVLAVTGPSQRYCLRELEYQGFMASDIVTTEITGGEFISVLTRADAYKKQGVVPDILRTSGGY